MTDGEMLKSCPFCGGTPRIFPVVMPFDADCDTITIECSDCDAIGANVMVDQDVHDQSDLPALEAEAIAAWNTRAPTDRDEGYARERDTIAAALTDMTIEQFRHWAANGTTYPNSYQSSIDRRYKEVDRVLRALADRQPDQRGGEVERLREALKPFAMSVLADAACASGWRVGYTTTFEQQRAAHLAYFGSPTALAAAPRPAEQGGVE